jgi:hypothetical protein
MTGDANSQPVDSVESLSDLAGFIGADEATHEEQEDAPVTEDGEQEEVEEGQEAKEGEEEDEGEEQEDATVVLKHDGKEIPMKQSEVIELA